MVHTLKKKWSMNDWLPTCGSVVLDACNTWQNHDWVIGDVTLLYVTRDPIVRGPLTTATGCMQHTCNMTLFDLTRAWRVRGPWTTSAECQYMCPLYMCHACVPQCAAEIWMSIHVCLYMCPACVPQCAAVCCSMLPRAAVVCCSVLLCCSVLPCIAVCCTVLQCSAVRYSVLQRVAAWYTQKGWQLMTNIRHDLESYCNTLECCSTATHLSEDVHAANRVMVTSTLNPQP